MTWKAANFIMEMDDLSACKFVWQETIENLFLWCGVIGMLLASLKTDAFLQNCLKTTYYWSSKKILQWLLWRHLRGFVWHSF